MRQWDGIRDDTSDVGGDGFSAATGVSFVVEGELRRRPGLTYLASYGRRLDQLARDGYVVAADRAAMLRAAASDYRGAAAEG